MSLKNKNIRSYGSQGNLRDFLKSIIQKFCPMYLLFLFISILFWRNFLMPAWTSDSSQDRICSVLDESILSRDSVSHLFCIRMSSFSIVFQLDLLLLHQSPYKTRSISSSFTNQLNLEQDHTNHRSRILSTGHTSSSIKVKEEENDLLSVIMEYFFCNHFSFRQLRSIDYCQRDRTPNCKLFIKYSKTIIDSIGRSEA